MRLPSTVHEANVAGLEPKNPLRKTKCVPDNTPSARWVANRIIELKGNVEAQTALLEACPYDVQEAIWDILGGHA